MWGHEQLKQQRGAIDALFFRRFWRFLYIAFGGKDDSLRRGWFPSLKRERIIRAILITLLVLAVEALQIHLGKELGKSTGNFYAALVDKNQTAFWAVAAEASTLAASVAFTSALSPFFAGLLGVEWRENFSRFVQNAYFEAERFYETALLSLRADTKGQETLDGTEEMADLPLGENENDEEDADASLLKERRSQDSTDGRASAESERKKRGRSPFCSRETERNFSFIQLDNPDQRISRDIDLLTSTLSSKFAKMLLSPYPIILYFSLTLGVSGWKPPIICVAVFFGGALINRFLLRPLVRFVYIKEEAEGNFRKEQIFVVRRATDLARKQPARNNIDTVKRRSPSRLVMFPVYFLIF